MWKTTMVSPYLQLLAWEKKTSKQTKHDYLELSFTDNCGRYLTFCDKTMEHKSLLKIRAWYRARILVEQGKYSTFTITDITQLPSNTTITFQDGSKETTK